MFNFSRAISLYIQMKKQKNHEKKYFNKRKNLLLDRRLGGYEDFYEKEELSLDKKLGLDDEEEEELSLSEELGMDDYFDENEELSLDKELELDDVIGDSPEAYQSTLSTKWYFKRISPETTVYLGFVVAAMLVYACLKLTQALLIFDSSMPHFDLCLNLVIASSVIGGAFISIGVITNSGFGIFARIPFYGGQLIYLCLVIFSDDIAPELLVFYPVILV